MIALAEREPVAIRRTVAEDRRTGGVFDMATAAGARKRGAAWMVLSTIARWACRAGCTGCTCSSRSPRPLRSGSTRPSVRGGRDVPLRRQGAPGLHRDYIAEQLRVGVKATIHQRLRRARARGLLRVVDAVDCGEPNRERDPIAGDAVLRGDVEVGSEAQIDTATGAHPSHRAHRHARVRPAPPNSCCP